MRRMRKHEEHANHEAWAIPYGDLLTLLLAFFVVMYAISSVNEGKYRVLSDSLHAAFRGTPRTMEPIQIGEKQVGAGSDVQASISQRAMLGAQPRSIIGTKSNAEATGRGGDANPISKLPPGATAAAAALSRVADDVERAMNPLVKQNLVLVRRNDFWIEVEMRTDVLFPSGSAHLATNAVAVIEKLGGVLGPLQNPIRVEGHTDNVPIKTTAFYSNWELSAARAGSVVRVLATHGVDPNRLAVVGYGAQRPLQPNTTADGRNANRRVVVVILSTELMRHNDPTATPGSADPSNATTQPSDAATPPTPPQLQSANSRSNDAATADLSNASQTLATAPGAAALAAPSASSGPSPWQSDIVHP